MPANKKKCYFHRAAHQSKQFMGKKTLHKDSEFIVAEEKVINYVMAIFFLALFLYGVADAVKHRFINIDYQSYVFALAIIPAIYCIRRANNNRVYIRVNRTGIYYQEELLTSWANFHNAFIDQKEKNGFFNIKDNFLLVVEYRKEGHQEGFRKKIPLTNTQNKSEEEVLEAVIFFWNEYRMNSPL